MVRQAALLCKMLHILCCMHIQHMLMDTLPELSFHLQCRRILQALKTCTENNATKFMVSTRQKKKQREGVHVCVSVCVHVENELSVLEHVIKSFNSHKF